MVCFVVWHTVVGQQSEEHWAEHILVVTMVVFNVLHQPVHSVVMLKIPPKVSDRFSQITQRLKNL